MSTETQATPDPQTPREGVAGEEEARRALAESLGLPFLELERTEVDPRALELLPAELARRHRALPVRVEGRHVVVAMHDPTDLEALGELRFVTGLNVEPAVATLADIERAIDRLYGPREEAVALRDVAPAPNPEAEARARAERLARERPIVRLVEGLILDAIRRGASDIHIRPGEQDVELSLRIDGHLLPVRRFSKALLAAVIARIKVLGRMDLAEHRLPQDGRTRVEDGGHAVDLRISVLPTVTGESAVLRILDRRAGLRRLEDIGFAPGDEARLHELLERSHGLFLVTGPTGSGKSTTLYAALQAVRERGGLNIVTVEDPVEYSIPGVLQIQVNRATGLDFARALRNILRHDPDVIMVGEIRDRETGRIAVESALTGHLVLSTLHTNDAPSTVIRLLEMGIENYLVSGTLLGVLAQRLLRRNCPRCAKEGEAAPALRAALGVGPDEVFRRGTGCAACHGTGYRGRLAAYELLVPDGRMRDLIRAGPDAQALRRAALEAGMVPLTQHALGLARQGLTSLEEVYRVRLD